MKDIRTILPNIASDTTGAAAALFEAEGLTIIHDAAGAYLNTARASITRILLSKI